MNVLFSFKQLRTLLAMLAMMIFSFPDAVADAPSLIIKDLGEGHCLVQINTNQRYLLLPVEEVMPDVRVSEQSRLFRSAGPFGLYRQKRTIEV